MTDAIALLSVDEASKRLGLAKSTLAKMRLRGDGPSYVKLGPRRIAYRENDLTDWIDARRFCSTSQY